MNKEIETLLNQLNEIVSDEMQAWNISTRIETRELISRLNYDVYCGPNYKRTGNLKDTLSYLCGLIEMATFFTAGGE